MKASELEGKALDWAVNEIEMCHSRPQKWSSDWAQGGPIIEREGITVASNLNHSEGAGTWAGRPYNRAFIINGPTPLVAAMRAFVASKLGDEVEIPEELL